MDGIAEEQPRNGCVREIIHISQSRDIQLVILVIPIEVVAALAGKSLGKLRCNERILGEFDYSRIGHRIIAPFYEMITKIWSSRDNSHTIAFRKLINHSRAEQFV